MLYASKSQLKNWLRLPSNVTDDDEKLKMCAEVASQAVDAYCGRDFTLVDPEATATARVFEADDEDEVYVDDIGAEPTDLIVETSYNQVSWVELDTTFIIPGPLRVLTKRVPEPYTFLESVRSGAVFREYVRVTTACWGWPGAEVTPAARTAALLIGAWLYQRAEAPMGFVPGEIPARVPRNGDSNVAQLLDPLCRVERTIGIA